MPMNMAKNTVPSLSNRWDCWEKKASQMRKICLWWRDSASKTSFSPRRTRMLSWVSSSCTFYHRADTWQYSLQCLGHRSPYWKQGGEERERWREILIIRIEVVENTITTNAIVPQTSLVLIRKTMYQASRVPLFSHYIIVCDCIVWQVLTHWLILFSFSTHLTFFRQWKTFDWYI